MEKEALSGIRREPLGITREYDLALSQFQSKESVDRSNWKETVLNQNEDVRKMREIANPLQRAISFSRLYLPENRVASPELVISLISQHLRTLGLVESQAALHREWENVPNIPHKQDSQLALLSQRALFKARQFWDITVPSCHCQQSPKLTQAALDTEISTTIGSTPKRFEDQIPLLQEKEGDPDFIKYENDVPVEASLNQVIYYTTTRKPGFTELMKAMCLTLSSYSTNKVFCKKVCERTQQIIDSNENKDDAKIQSEIIPCIKLLVEWISGSGNTLEPEILESIQKFVDSNIRPKFPKIANMISVKSNERDSLGHLLNGKTKHVELGNVSIGLWTGKFDLCDLPPAELARQLTVWSYKRYYAIQRTELLDCAWEKPRLKHKAPNVVALSSHFNIISTWAASRMLKSPCLKTRVATISYFIDVMRYLFKKRNYFDTMGILGGLDSNALFRMKVHFSLLPQADKDTLAAIQAECTPDKNFAQMRKLFDQVIEKQKPSLPYIGILLSDLFKFDDATQPFVNGLMNLRKVKKVYQMISRIEDFTKQKYMFLPIDQVQDKLDALELTDEEQLCYRSGECEKDGAVDANDCENIV